MSTTIKVSDELHATLKEEKKDGESFDSVLKRLLGEDYGQMWTEDEIRSMARAEAKDMIREFGGSGQY